MKYLLGDSDTVYSEENNSQSDISNTSLHYTFII